MRELKAEKNTKRTSNTRTEIELDRHESEGRDHAWTQREIDTGPFLHRSRPLPNQLTCIECTVGLTRTKREAIRRGEYHPRYKSM